MYHVLVKYQVILQVQASPLINKHDIYMDNAMARFIRLTTKLWSASRNAAQRPTRAHCYVMIISNIGNIVLCKMHN